MPAIAGIGHKGTGGFSRAFSWDMSPVGRFSGHEIGQDILPSVLANLRELTRWNQP